MPGHLPGAVRPLGMVMNSEPSSPPGGFPLQPIVLVELHPWHGPLYLAWTWHTPFSLFLFPFFLPLPFLSRFSSFPTSSRLTSRTLFFFYFFRLVPSTSSFLSSSFLFFRPLLLVLFHLNSALRVLFYFNSVLLFSSHSVLVSVLVQTSSSWLLASSHSSSVFLAQGCRVP